MCEGEPEVIIVGSGLAGSVLATVLARDGRKVVLLERNPKHRVTLCGEVLQLGAITALHSLGLQECLETTEAAIFRSLNTVTTDLLTLFRVDTVSRDNKLTARIVDYGRFVLALRDVARQEDRVRYVEGSVTELIEERGSILGVRYHPQGTEHEQSVELRAPLTVVADGPNSRFRKQLGLPPAQPAGVQQGFVMKSPPELAIDGGYVIYGDEVFTVTYPYPHGERRVIICIPEHLVNPAVTTNDFCRQRGLQLLPDAVRRPYEESMEAGSQCCVHVYAASPGPVRMRGVLAVGDAMSGRHPITASGVLCTLQDVVLLRPLLGELNSFQDEDKLHSACKKFNRQRTLQHGLGINILAGFLELFAISPDAHIKKLKVGSLDYMFAKGFRKDITDNAMNGINYVWYTVVIHLMLSVVYGSLAGFKPGGVPGLPRAIYDSLAMLYKGIVFLLSITLTDLKCVW